MSDKFRLDRRIGFQNTFYTKCISVIIDSIGPSIILRSILSVYKNQGWFFFFCKYADKENICTKNFSLFKHFLSLISKQKNQGGRFFRKTFHPIFFLFAYIS